MNRLFLILKQRIITVIFILVAISGGIFVYLYINNIGKVEDRDKYRDLIYIAANDIEKGEEIPGSILVEQKIDSSIYDERYISEKELLINKKAVMDIKKGEILTKGMVEGIGTGTGEETDFSAYIPYGYRTVCIPVIFYGESLLLKPGDRVDIISTFYNHEEGRVESRTILKEKEIVLMAGDRSTSPGCDQEDSNIFFDPGSGGNTDHDGYGKMLLLTFYLKPPEAEEVFKALEEGMLNLAICPCAAGSWMNHQAG